MVAPASQPGSADETILASARAPQPAAPAGPLEAQDSPMPRLFDVPTATAADAVVPEPERRERYPARMIGRPLPPAAPPASTVAAPLGYVDGELVARRKAQLRRRQAVWVIGAAVAAGALALAALILVLLFT